MPPLGPLALLIVVGNWLLNKWKIIAGFGIFTILKNRFRKLNKPIQWIMKIILVLVPAGLLAIMLYAKYISYLDSAAISQQPVKYLVAMLISLFGIIIFAVLFIIISWIMERKGAGELAKDTVIGIKKVSTKVIKNTGKVAKIAGGNIGKGAKLASQKSVKGIKVVGKNIKNGTTHTVKKITKIGENIRKFRRKGEGGNNSNLSGQK
ncbi:MAG: hypothetical protein KJ887_04040 [Candidatus Omnitrophica bacterium]|nr:hypothetical protein [Candidatus Omnitrophota bacterium]MBU1047490.1 hypothetical protein [Candidatus Omnitrophota bacterium]MBU1767748.1 hypothetical protein [Candidatus Omnitrophota bacterium]MBU1888853.1 hypothetical protein [Candidatus Omnitrophota bacterium]